MNQSITTLTQKGQITIPKALRDYLSLKSYDRVIIEKADQFLKILPIGPSIFDLAGTFKIPKNKPLTSAREAMEKNYSRF